MVLGIYINTIRLKNGTRKISAMSNNLSFVCWIPVKVLIYKVGRTIMAGINTDKSSASSHNSTRITKEATGTDFITFIGNHTNVLNISLTEEKMARIIPMMPPIKNLYIYAKEMYLDYCKNSRKEASPSREHQIPYLE